MRRLAVLILALAAASLTAEPIDDATFDHVLRIADAYGVPRSVAAAQLFAESGDRKAGSRGDFAIDSKQDEDAEGFHSAGGFQIYMNPEKNLNWLLETFWKDEAEDFDVYNYVHNTTLAMCYMHYLHDRFGSWYLAAARFNCGPNRPTIPAESLAYARRIINAK